METINNVTSINQDRSFAITSEPNDATLKMPWGINPPVAKPIAWGARAIFRRTTHTADLDYVWDRQEMVGGTEEERQAFVQWINKEAIPRIRTELMASDIYPRDATQVELPWKGFMIVFSPKQSCGYLYIGIWPMEGMIAASSDVASKPGVAKAKGSVHDPRRKSSRVKGAERAKKPFLAVVIEPGKKPEIRDIGDAKLETIQKLVGGYIEHVTFFPKPKYTVVVNEEGVIHNLPFNRNRVIDKRTNRGVHRLHGTIVIHKTKSLTREEAEAIVKEWS